MEGDEDPVARRQFRVPGQDHPAMDLRHVGAGEVESGPPGSRPLDGLAVDLDFSNPDLPTAGQQSQRVATADSTAAERAGDDRAAALHAECPVDRQPCGSSAGIAGHEAFAQPLQLAK